MISSRELSPDDAFCSEPASLECFLDRICCASVAALGEHCSYEVGLHALHPFTLPRGERCRDALDDERLRQLRRGFDVQRSDNTALRNPSLELFKSMRATETHTSAQRSEQYALERGVSFSLHGLQNELHPPELPAFEERRNSMGVEILDHLLERARELTIEGGAGLRLESIEFSPAGKRCAQHVLGQFHQSSSSPAAA